jgi:hypothetical protein
MHKDLNKIDDMATTAIEALILASRESRDQSTSCLILTALAMVTQVRKEVSELNSEDCPGDAGEYCFPV